LQFINSRNGDPFPVRNDSPRCADDGRRERENMKELEATNNCKRNRKNKKLLGRTNEPGRNSPAAFWVDIPIYKKMIV
jgi:hypothetical protein